MQATCSTKYGATIFFGLTIRLGHAILKAVNSSSRYVDTAAISTPFDQPPVRAGAAAAPWAQLILQSLLFYCDRIFSQ
jgi:hypothetical protein